MLARRRALVPAMWRCVRPSRVSHRVKCIHTCPSVAESRRASFRRRTGAQKKPAQQSTAKMPGFAYERKYQMRGHDVIAGVSVAGERSMAGPVVGAAVIVREDVAPVAGVRDPSLMSLEELREVYEALVTHEAVRWKVASVSHKSVDHLTIIPVRCLCGVCVLVRRVCVCVRAAQTNHCPCLFTRGMPPRHPRLLVPVSVVRFRWQALGLACSDAVAKFDEPEPTWMLTDCPQVPPRLRGRCLCLPGNGLGSSYSIAAAAVVAAVHHRRVMMSLHQRWPEYGFLRHMGRPTAAHKAALRKLGPSPAHRLMAGLGLYARIGYE